MDTRSRIQAHYATGYEAERLSSGAGELERLRTQDILSRFLPPAPADVLDVGGGPGVYSAWLGQRGYTVQLVDLVELHVAQAAHRFTKIGLTNARARRGDARQLEEGAETQDVVLLMGPLYHLQERHDRARALDETWRVLRPGGLLVATAISRFASLLDGFIHGFLADPEFVAIAEEDLRTGRHENPTPNPLYFSSAYFHRPDELQQELHECGFERVEVLGVEGPFWCLPGFEERWQVPETRAWMLEQARRVEHEVVLHGMSAHLLTLGTKSAR